ncbi:hypothetical protein U1Q18_031810 [Sarracenia purpurea var. burkii]
MSVDTQSVDGRVRQRVDGTLKQFQEQLGAIPSLRSELEARLKILEERVEVLTFSMRDLWNRLRIFEVRLEERAGGIERRNGGLERMIQIHCLLSRKMDAIHAFAREGDGENLLKCIGSMKDAPNVAEKACGALYFLAQGYEDEIVQSILVVTHREDAMESRLRTAAYKAMNEVERCSSDETASMVIIQKLGSLEPNKNLFMQYADQIMNLFLRVFGCRSSTVHEEAILAIGALAYATGPDFVIYMLEFYKYLEMGLQNFGEYQVLCCHSWCGG